VTRRIGIDFLLIDFSECLQDVQRQRELYQQEESARIFLANEDLTSPMNLTNTLKKLNTDQQPMVYYIGGIDLLCQLIQDGLLKRKKIVRQISLGFF
jgi:hypothetical protein